MSLAKTIRRLLHNRSGVAMTEFALGAPFLLMAGLWGTETANFALVNMKVHQLAVHIADNASRVGDTDTLQNRKIYELDIYDLLLGANIQGGPGIDLFENGRVVISSVEIWDQSIHANVSSDQSDGVPFIHWQRCKGAKNFDSDFGVQNSAQPDGIGPEGEEVLPEPGSPVMFVEISYDYQPLISDRFFGSTEIKSIASFMVRDSRDQSQLYKRNDDDPIADCNVHDAFT